MAQIFNPVLDGIQAFGAIRQIQNNDQLMKDRSSDRELVIEDRKIAADQRARKDGLTDEIMENKRVEWGRATENYDRKVEGLDAKDWEKELGILANLDTVTPKQWGGLKEKAPSYAQNAFDAVGSQSIIENYRKFSEGIKSGNYNAALEAINSDPGMTQQLQERAVKAGNRGIKLVGVRPGQTEGNVFLEAMIQRKDGTTYGPVPLTMNGGTEAQGDNVVKEWPIDHFMGHLAGQATLASATQKIFRAVKPIKDEYGVTSTKEGGATTFNKKTGKPGSQIISPMAQGGGEKAFNREEKLRNSYLKHSGDFIKVRDSYGRVLQSAKNPSAAGDLVLVFNYMKILDPGSVVRESEFATASNAAGVPDRIRNIYNRVLNGERLAENQRGDFVDRAGKLYEGMTSQHKQRVTNFEKLSRSYNLNPDNVLLDLSLAEIAKTSTTLPEDLSTMTDDELMNLIDGGGYEQGRSFN